MRRNLDPDYAYILMSRKVLAAPEYSVAGHDVVRTQQGRRVRFPPQRVNLNSYYGVGDQIIVVTTEAGAVFVHRRTGTLNFYQEEVEGFVNAVVEEELGFWGVETPHMVPQQLRFHVLSMSRPTRPLQSIVHGSSTQLRHRRFPRGELR